MTVQTRLCRGLTSDEKAALGEYGADSIFLHAMAQGRASDFERDPLWRAFWPRSGKVTAALDSAIAASELVAPVVLYSAYGNGFGVRGSIIGDPRAFVGMEYCYPGYISTTSDPEFRDRFLEKRRNANSRPSILEFRLPAGFQAMDMHHGGHAGEFEFLLGRASRFQITGAKFVDGDILLLVLTPSARAQPVSDGHQQH